MSEKLCTIKLKDDIKHDNPEMKFNRVSEYEKFYNDGYIYINILRQIFKTVQQKNTIKNNPLRSMSAAEINEEEYYTKLKNKDRGALIAKYMGSSQLLGATNLGSNEYNGVKKNEEKITCKDYQHVNKSLSMSMTEPRRYLRNSHHTFDNNRGFYA